MEAGTGPGHGGGPPSPMVYFAKTRKPYLMATFMSGFFLCLLFLADMSYLFGSVYKNVDKTHALKILLVDYDQGGSISQSLRAAYSGLESDSFVSLHERPAADFEDTEAIDNAVCSGDYWAAIYVTPSASSRLDQALQGGPAAENYNDSVALGAVWNEIRYPVISQGYVQGQLHTLVEVTASVYYGMNGAQALSTMNQTDAGARAALFSPVPAVVRNLSPVGTGARVLWNTATIPFLILIQFFFILALNGITQGFKYYAMLPAKTMIPLRLAISLVYTFAASLISIGYIWAFRKDWDVSGSQFVLSWMAIWLTNHACFLFIDTVAAVIPIQFMSHVMLTWIIINVTSTIFPFELSAGFYRVGYALPYHNLYEIFVTIWSRGCGNRLYRNLPIIFAWWVAYLGIDLWAQLRKCRLARQEREDNEIDQPQTIEGRPEKPEKPVTSDSSD